MTNRRTLFKMLAGVPLLGFLAPKPAIASALPRLVAAVGPTRANILERVYKDQYDEWYIMALSAMQDGDPASDEPMLNRNAAEIWGFFQILAHRHGHVRMNSYRAEAPQGLAGTELIGHYELKWVPAGIEARNEAS